MSFSYQTKIYWEDVDGQNIVYHANYLKFFERARTEWLRSLGFTQSQLQQQYNCVFVVNRIVINYFKPIFLDDTVSINTKLLKRGNVSLQLTQNLYRLAPELPQVLVCSAQVRLAWVDTLNHQSQKMPINLKQTLLVQ